MSEATDFLQKHGFPDVDFDARWLETFRTHPTHRRLIVEGAELNLSQWAKSGFHLRFAEHAFLESWLAPVVLFAPASPKFHDGSTNEWFWLWVSADFPERFAALPPLEGLRWSIQSDERERSSASPSWATTLNAAILAP